MLRKFLLAAAPVAGALFALPVQAQGDLKSDIATCAVMQGDLDRLGCYDTVAKSAGLNGPQPVPVATTGGTGKWQVSSDKNPIDDSQRVVVKLTADEGQSRFEGPVTFIARCQSKKTEAYVTWGEYLGNDGDIYNDYKDVTVRVGNEAAKTQRWSTSTDSKATFAPDWAGTLLKKMTTANKLVMQVTPYNESPMTAIFDTTGMSAALEPLAKDCGWQLDVATPAAASAHRL